MRRRDNRWFRKLVIRRLICTNCNTLHSELPDTVIPYNW
ncbi:MAG: DUF6431 domain-containing protein [Clostridiales bacterium]|nr:DUF6431 domain-containing protein [Clostridiales bacterium]